LSVTGIGNGDEGHAFVFHRVPAEDVAILHDVVGKVRILAHCCKQQAMRQLQMSKTKKHLMQKTGQSPNPKMMATQMQMASVTNVQAFSKGLMELLESLIDFLSPMANNNDKVGTVCGGCISWPYASSACLFCA
jgi:hypothetical protein